MRTRHPYALKGLVFCGACKRRMQGNWVHGRAHYRCRFPSEYALANKIDHPLAVYLREDMLLEVLDPWLTEMFAPERIQQALELLQQAHVETSSPVDVVRAEIAECDRKLARYKAALEAGADPVVVAGWIREAQRQRDAAEGRLTDANTRKERRSVSVMEIKSWADSIGGLLKVLNAADPAEKATVYRQLGTTLTFDHEKGWSWLSLSLDHPWV